MDEPAQAAPIQEYAGSRITILCGVSAALLKEIGVFDQKGAPWYDRILFGAPDQPIAMPAVLVIDKAGKIIFASRAARVDYGPRLDEILASLAHL